MYHSFLIHSFADGHLGCFQHLAIVNCAAMNTGVHRFFLWIGVSGLLGYNPRSGCTVYFNKNPKGLPRLLFTPFFTLPFKMLLHSKCVNKNTMVHLYDGILHSRKKEGATTLCHSMDGTGEHYAQ